MPENTQICQNVNESVVDALLHLWKNKSFKDFLINAREKNIVCFGTGEYLATAKRLLAKHDLKIAYAVDNDFWQNGTNIEGIEISTVDRLIHDTLNKTCVLICDLAIFDIAEQLLEADIQNFFALPLFAEEWYRYQNRFVMKIPLSNRTLPMWGRQCFITIVNACNLKCPFCAFAGNPSTGEYMSYEAFIRTAEQLKSLRINGQKVDTIRLGGNREGLLHPHFADMAYHLDSNGFKPRLVTNGVLMTKEIATVIVKYFHHVRISVTGVTSEVYHHFQGSERHDSNAIFNTVVNNVTELINIRNRLNSACFVDIGYICTEFSAHQMKDAILFWRGKGCDRILFGYEDREVSLPVKEADDKDICYTVTNGARELCFYTTTIAANGDVYPCCEPYGEYMPIGNCFKTSLNAIFNSQEFYMFRKDLASLNPKQLPHKCRHCTAIAYKK